MRRSSISSAFYHLVGGRNIPIEPQSHTLSKTEVFRQFTQDIQSTRYGDAADIAQSKELDIDFLDELGMRAIDYAVLFHQQYIVKTLLSRGAATEHTKNALYNPIVIAIQHHNISMIMLLMSFGAPFKPEYTNPSCAFIINPNPTDTHIQLYQLYTEIAVAMSQRPEIIAYQHMQKTHHTNIEEYKTMKLTDDVVTIIEEALKDQDFVKRLESWKEDAQHSK